MSFATSQDIGARLGRDLAVDEQSAVELVIEIVSGQIADAVDRDDEWADALDPVPAVFRAICIEKAVSALTNTENLASLSRTLGKSSISKTFPRSADGGILLSEYEERLVRRAVVAGVAGPRIGSVLDDILACPGS